ncbi:hypothetical protein [Roseivirga pacifica]
MNLLKTTFLLLFCSSNLFSQEIKKGLILPKNEETFKPCCIYIPSDGISVYDQDMNSIGRLMHGELSNSESYEAFFLNSEGIKQSLNPRLFMIGYEVMALTYSDINDKLVKIENIGWLKLEELESSELIAIDWLNYLQTKRDVLGYYANEPGFDLRTAPNINSEKIVTAKGDLYQITPLANNSGKWCKVKVTKYKKHPCSGEQDLIEHEYLGWMKIISDNDTPNLWSYGKGC